MEEGWKRREGRGMKEGLKQEMERDIGECDERGGREGVGRGGTIVKEVQKNF